MLNLSLNRIVVTTLAVIFILVGDSGFQLVNAQRGDEDCRQLDEEVLPTDPRVQLLSQISDMSVSPDGQILAFIFKGNLALYSTENLESIDVLPVARVGEVRQFTWSPDGKYIATGTDAIGIWDVTNGERIAHLNESHFLMEIMWSDDGKYLLGLGLSSGLHVWETEKWEELGIVFEPDSSYSAGFRSSIQVEWISHLEKVIIIQGAELFLWDFVHSNQPVLTVELSNSGYIYPSIEVSPNELLLAIGNEITPGIELWNTETWTLETTLSPRPSNYWDIDWSPDGSQLAIAGSQTPGCTVALWDLEPLAETFEYLGTNPGWVTHVAWTPDGQALFAALQDGTIYKWEVSSETLLGIIVPSSKNDE
jgi:WD40 repeat protein